MKFGKKKKKKNGKLMTGMGQVFFVGRVVWAWVCLFLFKKTT
jgi:hypothetical protein